MFGVQNGGWCASSASAPQTFDKYGQSNDCEADGEGGLFANHVYTVIQSTSMGTCVRRFRRKTLRSKFEFSFVTSTHFHRSSDEKLIKYQIN